MALAIGWVMVAASAGLPPFSKKASTEPSKNSVARPARNLKIADLPGFSVPTLDGRTIKMTDYAGKVLVVDFWATWCPPCRAETPKLVAIANENRARGVEVIGLHIDDQGRSSPEQIRQFIRQFGVTYTVGMASNDMFEAYLGDETQIPQTLVFGRDGKLIKHFVGYSPAHGRELDETVSAALSGS
jgi:cytochrome c biogenesis protein CcmG/thiol:disulfide interchange protein DsbE